MEPMYLPDVESHEDAGPLGQLLRRMEGEGAPVSQILRLFAFKPGATRHLERFTHEVMRGPSPLSPGLRELLAALSSRRRACLF